MNYAVLNGLRSFVRLVAVFSILRIVEAGIGILGIIAATSIVHVTERGKLGDPVFHVSDALSTGSLAVWTYDVVFGYLIVSAVIFIISWLLNWLSTSRGLTSVNIAAFLIHSGLIIAGLHGHLPLALWITWFIVFVYNIAFPAALKVTVTRYT
jgi:hypothetical protein